MLHVPVDKLCKYDISPPPPAAAASASSMAGYPSDGNMSTGMNADTGGILSGDMDVTSTITSGMDGMDVVDGTSTATVGTSESSADQAEAALPSAAPSSVPTSFKLLSECPLLINTILHIYTKLVSTNIAGMYIYSLLLGFAKLARSIELGILCWLQRRLRFR